MGELEKLRMQLDKIDDGIIKLYEQRMAVCAEIGRYKAVHGKKVLDVEREEKKLADAASKVSDPKNKDGVRELFNELMTLSRQLQEGMIKAESLKD